MTRRGILLIVIVVAIAVPAVLISAAATPFPGRETGARQAANRGDAVAVNAAVTANGIELRVTGFLADETATVVSYTLRGREGEGTTALGKSPPQLIDSRGNVYMVRRGSLDLNDRRSGTWIFPPIEAQAGTLTLVLDGLELGSPGDGQPMAVTNVQETWRVQFAWNGRRAALGAAVSVPSEPTSFGRGTVRLTTVKRGVVGTIISGTLEGFSADNIQAMDCPITSARQQDGTVVAWIACRFGFGEGYRSFEVTFPDLKGQVSVDFELHYPNIPGRQGLSSDAKADDGATASFGLSVPQR